MYTVVVGLLIFLLVLRFYLYIIVYDMYDLMVLYMCNITSKYFQLFYIFHHIINLYLLKLLYTSKYNIIFECYIYIKIPSLFLLLRKVHGNFCKYCF